MILQRGEDSRRRQEVTIPSSRELRLQQQVESQSTITRQWPKPRHPSARGMADKGRRWELGREFPRKEPVGMPGADEDSGTVAWRLGEGMRRRFRAPNPVVELARKYSIE